MDEASTRGGNVVETEAEWAAGGSTDQQLRQTNEGSYGMNDWFWVALGVTIPAVIFYGLWIVYGG